MKHHCLSLALTVSTSLAQAALITPTNLAEVTTFQQGLQVQALENASGRTPLAVDKLPSSTVAVGAEAHVYDQVPGFLFSSGFKPGEVMAGLFRVEPENGGGDGGSSNSNTVLAGLSPDNKSQFKRDQLIETCLPTKVSSLGFWLSADLGLSRSSADIGGPQIVAVSNLGFDWDDLSFGGSGGGGSVPEPMSAALVLVGLLAAASTPRRSRRPF